MDWFLQQRATSRRTSLSDSSGLFWRQKRIKACRTKGKTSYCRYQQKSLLAATAAGLNHLISFPKKVQVHFGQDKYNRINYLLAFFVVYPIAYYFQVLLTGPLVEGASLAAYTRNIIIALVIIFLSMKNITHVKKNLFIFLYFNNFLN